MQRNIYNIAILSIVFLCFSCGDKAAEKAQAEMQKETTTDNRIFVSKVQFENSKMSIGSIEEKPFSVTIKTNGMIDVPPENRAVVNAMMGGYIKTTPLLIGDKVRKGQALVSIENPEFITIQQEYMEVNGQLVYLESEFERQKVMMAEKISSKKSFLQAESAYKTAKAKQNGLGKQLSMLNISPSEVEKGNISSVVTIYAPITGSITKVNVTRGTYVSPATPILEIIDNDHIHLELAVFEKDIMKLQEEQQINFKIPESSLETYEAEVHLIGTVIDENRTIKVHGHLEDESGANFLTGMFVEAEIVTESATTKALPERALAQVDDENFVLLLDEKTAEGYYFEQIEIHLGRSNNSYAEILNYDKFKPDATFLTNGTFNLVGESGGHEH